MSLYHGRWGRQEVRLFELPLAENGYRPDLYIAVQVGDAGVAHHSYAQMSVEDARSMRDALDTHLRSVDAGGPPSDGAPL